MRDKGSETEPRERYKLRENQILSLCNTEQYIAQYNTNCIRDIEKYEKLTKTYIDKQGVFLVLAIFLVLSALVDEKACSKRANDKRMEKEY